jgi:nucleoside-diphosphate-sugar epimerase
VGASASGLDWAPQAFHLVSSTFIYGWSTKLVVGESDTNAEMGGLDFGYSQTKWVAEQLVLAALRQGLDVRIYRPSLISPTTMAYKLRLAFKLVRPVLPRVLKLILARAGHNLERGRWYSTPTNNS